MKAGDRLYFIRNRYFDYIEYPDFTDGKSYTVLLTNSGYVDQLGCPIRAYCVIDDRGHSRILDWKIGFNVKRSAFVTDKEYRKLKLDKINESK